MQNFIDCVRSRENPIAPVEVGCSTNTLCCLANISRELNRPVKWDPATLSFVNDKEAAAHRLSGINIAILIHCLTGNKWGVIIEKGELSRSRA